MIRFIRRFRKDKSGVSAIEFAIVAMPMVLTFFGVAEIANYILAARKVANVASVAADLTAQDTVINNGEMADIMGALDVVLRPFSASEAELRITSVVADADGNLTVAWSDARNTTPRAPGSTPENVPADIVAPGQGIIMAEASFTYKSLVGMYLTSGMTVSDTFYLKPRRSTTVERQ